MESLVEKLGVKEAFRVADFWLEGQGARIQTYPDMTAMDLVREVLEKTPVGLMVSEGDPDQSEPAKAEDAVWTVAETQAELDWEMFLTA